MTSASSRQSPYAPIALRDEPWWQIGRRAAQRGDVGHDGTSDDEAIRLIALRALYSPDLGDLLQSPTPTDEALATHEQWAAAMELPSMVGQYELHGRQIFDMSSGLVEMLQHTDIRDCSFQNLQLPYPAFYMHFGRQAGIQIEGHEGGAAEWIDGALIGYAQDDNAQVLSIGLSCVDESGGRIRRTLAYTSLGADAMRLPAKEAIEAGVEHFLDGATASDDIAEWLDDFWAARRRHAGKAALAALPLIVNGLFYLENPPRPHRLGLAESTPKEVVEQWERAPAARRRKLLSKLNADGYTLVHLVGEEIRRTTNSGGDGTVAAHWRRGHWREQAHGPRMSLRKRILIKPVLVNGRCDTDPLDVPGHVYKSA